MTDNPMQSTPRCGAHARTTGRPCRTPAMANGRCRMHGGKGSGAPTGNRNALRHGMRSREATALRRAINAMLRESRALARALS